MEEINKILKYIVAETLKMNHIHIPDEVMEINYSAIFCQNDFEYEQFNKEASQIGNVIENTPTGPLYKLSKPLETLAGLLHLLKIRKPDPIRPERGDADFTLKDYNTFKEKYSKDIQYFKIIDRRYFEMIELKDKEFKVLSYFSNIPLTTQLNIK